MPTQCVRLCAAINANHSSKAPLPASLDPSQSVLEHNSAQRRNAKAARGFQEKRRIGLSLQSELVGIPTVDTLINQVVESCCT